MELGLRVTLESMKLFPKLEGIYAIAIPFPRFPDLVSANAYLIGGRPLTLIDTGPKVSGAWDALQQGIRDAGFRVGDIERILITHGHLDHFGLGKSLSGEARGEIECFIHEEDKWRVLGDGLWRVMQSEQAEKLMAMVGMPKKDLERIRKRYTSFKRLYDVLDRVNAMEDGQSFVGDSYNLKVIHTPGHTSGSCCFYECYRKILFSGDHIIKHITPNPLIEIKNYKGGKTDYQSLGEYMRSLDRVAKIDAKYVFSGHGEFIDDMLGVISRYKAHYRQRMQLVWEALKKKEGRPVYDLISAVFSYVPRDDIFLAVSEILVHLELLINEERAEIIGSGPPALYRAL